MSDEKLVRVPWSGGGKHPLTIGIQFNPQMRAHDLLVMVGNFKTGEDAKAYADAIKEFLEKNAAGNFQRVQ